MVTEAMEVDGVIQDKSKKREEGVDIAKTSQEDPEDRGMTAFARRWLAKETEEPRGLPIRITYVTSEE